MILVTAATAFEMQAFTRARAQQAGPKQPVKQLLCGIGPVEAALHLSVFLSRAKQLPEAVVNLGIAGAYDRQNQPAAVLDICLAEREELGDLGKQEDGRIEPLLVKNNVIPCSFAVDQPLLERMAAGLQSAGIVWKRGRFITVCCASGDRARGDMLLARYPDALCENMEGAALARVCGHYQVPFAEIRCISNMVDDPDKQRWLLQEACSRCGQAAAILFQEIVWEMRL